MLAAAIGSRVLSCDTKGVSASDRHHMLAAEFCLFDTKRASASDRQLKRVSASEFFLERVHSSDNHSLSFAQNGNTSHNI